MKRIFTLLCVTLFSLTTMANGVKIGDLYYILNSTKYTASVTYMGETCDDEPKYSGDVVIPDSISYLGDLYAVTSIGQEAFFKCVQMTSISIPITIKSIGYRAFSSCSKLEFLTFPSSVTSVGAYTFTPDMSGVYITCLAETPPSVQYSDLGAFLTVHVPEAVVDKYKKALAWPLQKIRPTILDYDKKASDCVDVSWLSVDSASMYKLHVNSDKIGLDTTLYIEADSLNGGIRIPQKTLTQRVVKRIALDDIGSIIVIEIDPYSGIDKETPYVLTISTPTKMKIGVRVTIRAYKNDKQLAKEEGIVALNNDVVNGIDDVLISNWSSASSIYDLYGHRYSTNQWSSVPAGIYILREGNKAIKVMKQ